MQTLNLFQHHLHLECQLVFLLRSSLLERDELLCSRFIVKYYSTTMSFPFMMLNALDAWHSENGKMLSIKRVGF
jgi:hypothetical protein